MSQKKALIVWGGWDGHTPEQCANVVKEILAQRGYEVVVESSTKAFANPKLGENDLIVPIITMSTVEADELKNLLAAVRAGSGLAGFHGQMCDAFRSEPSYQFMTGGQWVAHPGDIMDYSVQIAKKDDPIVAGIDDFSYRSEQYYMHYDPSVDVLATTTFDGTHFEEIDGVVMPVVWKKRFGKGKVFYSALGHVVDEFAVPQMRTIYERGAVWATR